MVKLEKLALFLGPKSGFLAEKSDFCHTTPILVKFSPWRDRSFPTLGAIFRLSVPELRPFVKKTRLTRHKSSPSPCEGTQRMIKLHSSNKPLLALYWIKTYINIVHEKNIEIFLWMFNIFSSLCHFIFSILQEGWLWLRGVLLLILMVRWQNSHTW